MRGQSLAFLGRPSWAGGVNRDSANRQRGRAEEPSDHLFVPGSARRVHEAVGNASFSLLWLGGDGTSLPAQSEGRGRVGMRAAPI